jgi:mRNA interferase RelE/StbE
MATTPPPGPNETDLDARLRLQRGLAEARSGEYLVFGEAPDAAFALEELWNPGTCFSVTVSACRAPDRSPWAIAFTPTFRKAISAIDRKLQGRVLSALAELSDQPTIAHGDTRKPLTGALKGLWRYRLGDYRLVYEPREERRLIVLIDLDSRGSVYEG